MAGSADTVALSEALAACRTGDIVLFSGAWSTSRIISRVAYGFSHVAVVAALTPGQPMLMEMVSAREHGVCDVVDDRHTEGMLLTDMRARLSAYNGGVYLRRAAPRCASVPDSAVCNAYQELRTLRYDPLVVDVMAPELDSDECALDDDTITIPDAVHCAQLAAIVLQLCGRLRVRHALLPQCYRPSSFDSTADQRMWEPGVRYGSTVTVDCGR